MKKCLIEAPFTFDAGPPIIAIKYSFYKYYLGCDKFKDMDGALYKFLDYNLEAYNHLLYLSGGMTFSYPFTAQLTGKCGSICTKKYCFADKEKGWFSYNFC